jgi:glycosidase
MPWSDGPSRGFTAEGGPPWLPFGSGPNVAEQRDDPASILSLCRDLLLLRRERDDLRQASYASLPAPAGVWAWARGDRYAAAVNLGDEQATVELSGSVLVATDRERDGEQVRAGLALGPAEGALLQTG